MSAGDDIGLCKKFKIFRICKGCNKKFRIPHKLRIYCDKCKEKMKG
jgi:hypothetical protein